VVRKTFLSIAFLLLALLIQGLIAPWMSIAGLRPDFLLILVLFVGRLEGKVVGQLFGFGAGLIADSIGIGSFLGLSALAKTVAGYGAGIMRRKQRRWSPIYMYLMEILVVLVHFLIIYLVNFKGSALSVQYIFFRYVLFSSLYTLVFYYLIKHFAALDLP